MKQSNTAELFSLPGEQLYALPDSLPWPVYPRPQLRRDSFFCLNGWWDFAVTTGEEPVTYDERIRVPFSPESLLSGVHRVPPVNSTLYYRREFSQPTACDGNRVLLHFGAADQIARVTLNGHSLTTHVGGYWPFTVDITEVLQENNTLVVAVEDMLNDKVQPYGKQRYDRGGMWYTPVSGLWQTVWMESVPDRYITHLRMDTALDKAVIYADGVTDGVVLVSTPNGEVTCPLVDGKAVFTTDCPRIWSPEDPYLYECTIEAGADRVYSYFALRTIGVQEVNGLPRICLNGEPLFLHALLDQGYWSDGLFLPAQSSGFDEDILLAKKLGYNTLRKHIKIEPELFYYACDRYGMLVWQDMVNNGDYSFIRDTALPTVGIKKLNDKQLHRDPTTRQAFEQAMVDTVKHLYNHPCIIGWTIFNEGWGQFDSSRLYCRLRELDSSRLIDSASGWFVGGESDVISPHVYFKPVRIRSSSKPVFLSEFGGYSYKVDHHSFNVDKTFGYRFFAKQKSFEDALLELYQKEIIPAISKGLCGAVYTQLADVEDETNGLVTYDRRVVKVDAERMTELAKKLRI